MERQILHPHEPWKHQPPILSTIPVREEALSLIHYHRQISSHETAWLFTDGSVTNKGAGATALLTCGPSDNYFTANCRSHGLHSSTQMELVAIDMGLRLVDIYRHHYFLSSIHVVTDSQAAVLALMGGRNATETIVAIRSLWWRLSESIPDLRITWVPGHANIPENEAADEAAHMTAIGQLDGALSDIPHALASLKRILWQHYTDEMRDMWATLSCGQSLRNSGWHFRPDL